MTEKKKLESSYAQCANVDLKRFIDEVPSNSGKKNAYKKHIKKIKKPIS